MIKELKNWEDETEKLKDIFIKRHFGIETSDVYWVADNIGRVLYVNDNYFSLNRILEAIKYNVSSKKLFEYQEMELACAMKDKEPEINFRNFVKYKKTDGK